MFPCQKEIDISKSIKNLSSPCIINLSIDGPKDISITLSNNLGEELIIGFDKNKTNILLTEPGRAKQISSADFAARHFAPRFTNNAKMEISLLNRY
jgi:fructan beta-fructosidase